MRDRLSRTGLAAVLATLLGCGVAEPPASAPPSPNLLVLVPDTVRGDHLSINGYPKPTSPALDALAREGVNFAQAITVAPRTWQSFSSILTGTYPPRHGVRYIFDDPIAEGTPILASEMRAAGYETAAFAGGAFLKEMTGGRGFDRYFSGGNDAEILRKVGNWVLGERKLPFLAFVKTSGGHWPYQADRWISPEEDCDEHDHSFNLGNYGLKRAEAGKGLILVDPVARRSTLWTLDVDERTLRHRIAHYDAEIRKTDALIGALIERLRGAGLLERTIVVVTSDHGESFGEHGYLQHGPRVDEPVMHVPLIMRFPASHPASGAGRQVDTLVRVVDIMPTLLEAVGLPLPPEVEGTSLIGAIRNQPDASRWIYGEAGHSFTGFDPDRHLPGIAGKHRMIRTEDWKLIHIPRAGGGEDRLFDLRTDPEERVDVAKQHPEVVRELRAHLEPILAQDPQSEEAQSLSPDQIDRLRELGYVD